LVFWLDPDSVAKLLLKVIWAINILVSYDLVGITVQNYQKFYFTCSFLVLNVANQQAKLDGSTSIYNFSIDSRLIEIIRIQPTIQIP